MSLDTHPGRRGLKVAEGARPWRPGKTSSPEGGWREGDKRAILSVKVDSGPAVARKEVLVGGVGAKGNLRATARGLLAVLPLGQGFDPRKNAPLPRYGVGVLFAFGGHGAKIDATF